MKKVFLLIMSLSLVFTACVKKQIKKDLQTSEQQQSTLKTETISTQTITMEGLTDETAEGDVRKEAITSLDTINFDFDKYELSENAKTTLSKNAKTILENKYTVTVEGHCDERGTNQYNLSLGQKRANVVKEYYIRLGVPEKNIATISYGEEKPLCFESTENCWAKNRRAETKVTK
ncbi:MAG: peptidoglycan-associated lipoprotein Pal [Elusimicrobiota bacterium]